MIVVLGDIAVDIVSRLRTPLVRGSDAGAEVRVTPGGSGANVAVWLARLGQAVTFVGRVGADPFGRWLADGDIAAACWAGVALGTHAATLAATR